MSHFDCRHCRVGSTPFSRLVADVDGRCAVADRWVLDLPVSTKYPSLNDRLHWAAKARQVAEWREAAWAAARHAQVPRCGRVRVLLVVTPPDRRQRDRINLTLAAKACEDGIVDAGVVPNDTPEFMESLMPVFTDPGKAWRYQLVVTDLTGDGEGEPVGGAA